MTAADWRRFADAGGLEQFDPDSPRSRRVPAEAAGPEHFRGCHPEDDQDPREVPEGYKPLDTEDCWHCGTPATRGSCACPDCLGGEDYVPASAVYHCQACGRWWAWMTGLNITTITFGAEE